MTPGPDRVGTFLEKIDRLPVDELKMLSVIVDGLLDGVLDSEEAVWRSRREFEALVALVHERRESA